MNLAEVWISILQTQLHVALYEAILSYPVYFLLSLGLLTTETSLKARIDTVAFVQCPISFRLVLEFHICELSLFLPTPKSHAKKLKKNKKKSGPFLKLIYLLIQTLHISHCENQLV